jgi:hypothetical protein
VVVCRLESDRHTIATRTAHSAPARPQHLPWRATRRCAAVESTWTRPVRAQWPCSVVPACKWCTRGSVCGDSCWEIAGLQSCSHMYEYMCEHACMCPGTSYLAHHSQGLWQHHVPVTVRMHMAHSRRCADMLPVPWASPCSCFSNTTLMPSLGNFSLPPSLLLDGSCRRSARDEMRREEADEAPAAPSNVHERAPMCASDMYP